MFTLVKRRITVPRAALLVSSGATVAWDPCGCAGYCGLNWFTPAEIAPRPGRPSVGPTGTISEWLGDDGTVLVLVEGDVTWRGLKPGG